jgi:RNA polymerase sigma-70 factor (ECF subfamily)
MLLLRDVLGWPANDVAALLGLSPAAVKSALQRARATMRDHLPSQPAGPAGRSATTEDEHVLLQRYVAAHERHDADALAHLLSEEVRLTMPPHPLWFVGRDAVVAFHAQVFDPTSPWYHGEWRTVATRANRQPAAANYLRRPGDSRFRAQVLDVLRVEEGRIVEITAFEPHLFEAFALPVTL